MNTDTRAKSRKITWKSSKQAFWITFLLVDKHLQDDCYRAYAYFRWADDVVDDHLQSRKERITFIREQRQLINHLYAGKKINDLLPEEQMIADLISHDRKTNPKLKSFIYNFLSIIEFEAGRKGELINEKELMWYSKTLGQAVADCIQYFIGNDYQYSEEDNRVSAATASHITHMLRDLREDISNGFINIPQKYLKKYNLKPDDFQDGNFKKWVKSRVLLARKYFSAGKEYINQIDLWRCKLAAYWYCTRSEYVLHKIEKDNYILRSDYTQRKVVAMILKIVYQTVIITFQHLYLIISRKFHG